MLYKHIIYMNNAIHDARIVSQQQLEQRSRDAAARLLLLQSHRQQAPSRRRLHPDNERDTPGLASGRKGSRRKRRTTRKRRRITHKY